MATRKNTFLLKRSNVAGNIPTAGQIQLGELALNTADVKLYASGTTTNSILPIGWDRISRTGDTMSGALYAPTISATTYQNLPLDIRVTGGTYSSGTATFRNNTGGTFSVTGFSTGTTTLDNRLLLTDSSTGLITFGGLSATSGGTTFNVGAIKAWFIDNYTDPVNPVRQYVELAAQTGIPVTNISGHSVTYVAVDSGGTIYQQATVFNPSSQRSLISLGVIVHTNRVFVNTINNQPVVASAPLSQLNDLIEGIGFFNINGNVFSPNGANLNINKSSGDVFKQGANFMNDNKNPHTLFLSGLTAPSNIRYRLQTGVEYANTAVIDPNNYDLNGVLTPVTGSKYTIQRINVFQSNLVRIQYGQHTYANLADAIQGIATEAFIVEDNILDNGLFRALLLVKANTTDLTNTADALFIEAGKFGSTAGLGSLSTTTLQQAYNNSTVPEILTNSILGGVSIQNGTGNANNVTNLLEGLNSTGSITSLVRADGYISGTTFQTNGFNANSNGVTATTVTATTLISTQSTGTSPLTVNSTTLVSNLNADYLDGQHGSFYYPASNPNGYTTNTGTVTQVNSGNGMNFTNFTTSGTITMGTPSSTTLASTNATTTNSHTHAFAPGGTTAQYITGAGTLVTFPTIVNTFVTGATVNNSTYDLTLTRNDGVTIVANLGILATDVKVTGGTYNPTTGVVTFTNTTGGTFNVTGFSTGMTDTFVTGGTYAAGTATFTRSNGATFNVTGFNTGTVTSVAALTLGTSGTDLNSTVANGTTTPVITLNVPDASATARGVITTGVQTIAGVKTLTSQLNGTVANFSQSSAGTTLTGYNGGVGGTGLSGGAANGIGGYFVNNSTTNPVVRLLGLSNTRLLEGRDTSDIATFSVTSTGIVSGSSFVRIGGTSAQFLKADGTVDSTTYVPTSRTLTINGTAFDLSTNRSWTIGGFTGGTVTGPTIFTGGVTANTISATTVIANNFTGLASLATSATTALNATNVGVTNNTTTNATYYVPFVSATSGNLPLQVDSATLTFNPSTNTLTVANLAGLASNATDATNANKIFTTNLPTTDILVYPTFVTGFGNNRDLYVDSSTLTYNPSSNILTLVNLVASGAITATTVTANNFTGLASLATSATTALNATNATTTDKIDNINFRNSDQTSPISAPDTLDSNGVGYVTNINLYGQIDGALYAQAYSSAWQHQIFGDYRTGQLAVRGKNSGTWQSWRNILDSTNFTNYAVPTGRTLTINGTTFDLSANRSWTITSGGFTGGTVTGPTNFTAGVTANTISATTVTVDTLNATNITGIGGLQNYVAKFSANGPFIGNSQIYDNGTSVGINTTSPSSTSKLDVNGVIRGIYMADPTTGETTAKFLSYSPSPYGLIFRGYSSGAHSIQSQREGNNTQLYPLSLQPLGGSVGINTTTPTVPLDVNGEALVRGPFTVSGSPTTLQYVRVNSDMDLFNSHVDSENYGTFSRLRLSRASGTQIAPTTPASGTAVGRLEFGAYNSGTGTFIMNAKVEAVMDATTGANDLPSRLSFFTTPDGSTTMAEVMRVNSLGNMRIGGLTMALSDVINVENGSVAFQNGYGLRFQSTGGTLYASVYSNNNDTVIKSLGDAIRFKNRTGTANRMSILDGGFVGINTNTPNQWLDVNGDALINGLTVGLGNSAYNNAVLGNQALGANTTGYNNVAIHSALPLNTTGTNNVGVGYKALFINTIGNDNVAVGVGSLQLNTSGEKNISIGSNSSYNNDNGQANIAIGANALFTNVNSSSNVAVGYNALYTNTGGANLALGHYAGYTLDGDGNNIIGTSNNQLPDANDLSNQSNTLSISKHTQITKGMPHFWAPDSISISPGAGYVLEADPLAYSAVFIDYSLEDQNGNLRAGTLKAIFNVTLATIKWDEVATSDIGSTSNYTFDFMDNGSGILGVELTNSGGVTVYCNLTSRLVSRTIL